MRHLNRKLSWQVFILLFTGFGNMKDFPIRSSQSSPEEGTKGTC